MTAFTTGARVQITAPSFPGRAGVVTDPANGNTVLTATVLVDATEYADACETYFAPDELEIIHDRSEAADVDERGVEATVPA